MNNMTTALISLGANTADKEIQLQEAIASISRIAHIDACTPIYNTPAEGSVAAAPYANALLQISTDSDYDTLNATFKSWEQAAGRTPASKSQGIIPLDVDIIIWDNNIIKQRDMQLSYMKQGLILLNEITRNKYL